MVRRALIPCCFALLAVGTGFSTPLLFAEPVHVGGGDGRFFTGSPRDGFGCEVCHRGAEGPRVEVHGLGDTYEPGSTLELTLTWLDEARDVGLMGEIVDAEGHAVGTLSTPPLNALDPAERCAGGNLAVRLVEDPEQVRTLFGVPACGAAALRVQWTAPAEDAGPAFVHIGAVGSDASDDPEGDGVWMYAHELSSPSGEAGSEGCRVGPGSTSALLLLLLLPLAGRRRPGCACRRPSLPPAIGRAAAG